MPKLSLSQIAKKHLGPHNGIVVVYATWCPACKNLFNRFGLEMNQDTVIGIQNANIPIIFVEIEQLDSSSKKSIQRIPTLFKYENGRIVNTLGLEVLDQVLD